MESVGTSPSLINYICHLGGYPHQMDELNHHLNTTTLRLAAVVERL